MAKVSKTAAKTAAKKSPAKRAPTKTPMGRLKDAALSTEMLAAGIGASAAAVAMSPKARRAIYQGGVDAADAAVSGAKEVKNSAAKLSAAIGEAVADAVLRVLSGDWPEDRRSTKSRRGATSKASSKRLSSARKS